MTHPSIYIKWFCRGSFAALALLMGYIVSRPAYNFAHWVPHNLLRDLGVPYSALLWGEQNADMLLHFMGAAVLTLLIRFAEVPIISQPALRAMICVVGLCFAAEALQLLIGRGVETSDLLLGILGSFVAYLAIDKN